MNSYFLPQTTTPYGTWEDRFVVRLTRQITTLAGDIPIAGHSDDYGNWYKRSTTNLPEESEFPPHRDYEENWKNFLVRLQVAKELDEYVQHLRKSNPPPTKHRAIVGFLYS